MKQRDNINIILFGHGNIGECVLNILGIAYDEWWTRYNKISVIVVDSVVGKKPIQSYTPNGAVLVTATCNWDYKDYLAKVKLPFGNETGYCINALPYFSCAEIAAWAINNKLHYLDFTEDVIERAKIRGLEKHALAKKLALMPGQGLAPGLITLKGDELIKRAITEGYVDIKCTLRVGALAENVNNMFNYAFTWSPEGVINEYFNTDTILKNGKVEEVDALTGLEQLFIDGIQYEAFYTAGGAGTLVRDYVLDERVLDIGYKTVRFPGHHAAIIPLSYRMGFNPCGVSSVKTKDVLTTKMIDEVPWATDDFVIMQAMVTAKKPNDKYRKQWCYSKRFKPHAGFQAIQWTTALGLVSMIDLHITRQVKQSGFLSHTELKFPETLIDRFLRR